MPEIVNSSDIVSRRGIYRYDGHIIADEDDNCNPTSKEISGRILVKGLPAPQLGCCPHEIKWSLQKELLV